MNILIEFFNNHSPLLYLTQSLWRDEAFSVLIAQHSVQQIISLTAQDFNPPLYYLILHFWIKIFGSGEIAIRMLSFIFFLALVYICCLFAKKLKLSSLTTYYLLLTTFLNPMLLYYAFEARMYSLLALLATASMYFFFSKNRLGYIISTALGLWTQPFMAFIILSQVFYSALQDFRAYSEDELKQGKRNTWTYFYSSLVIVFLLFIPWIPVILFQLTRSGPMWMWPINWTTVTTILGSLFTGYEGTPGGLWGLMTVFSLIILFFSLLVLRLSVRVKKDHPAEVYRLLLIWLFLPTLLVLTISYFKPIYVNRYLIFTTVAEIFIIIVGISLIKNKLFRNLFAIGYLLFVIIFNFWFPSRHAKLDIRRALTEINQLAQPKDLILSQTPLTFFEANYYTPKPRQIWLYNPHQTAVPLYVGASLITKDKMIYTLPKYPIRAFLIHDDGSYELIFQR